MKYIKEFLETVVKIKPLGELTTKDDELNGMSGEMVYIDGKCADIFISHADYANWLESKYEQKKCCGEVNDIALQQQLQIWFDKGKCSGRDEVIFHPEIYGLQKQGEHKPADNPKPKFKVGDWVAHNRTRTMVKVVDTKPMIVTVVDTLGYHHTISTDAIEENYHLWSIKDAKPGDVIAEDPIERHPSSFVAIYKKQNEEDFDTFDSYCFVGFDGKFYENEDGHCSEGIHPATTEQRDLLFSKMHEAGYTFDFEKKELKKLKFRVGDEVITENEESLTITRIDKKGYWSNDLFICDFDSECSWDLVEQKPTECIKFDNEFENQVSNLIASVLNGEHEYNEGFIKYVAQSLLGYAKNELKPTEWSHEDDVMVHDILGWLPTKTRPEYNQRRADWIKSLKNRVQPKYEWSEEDEKMFNSALWHIKNSCSNGGKNSGEFEVYNWLKSVKDRVQPQNNIVTDKELAQAKKEAYNETLDKIEYHDDWPTFDDGWNAAIWYLKKRNGIPLNRWKPSDDQMHYLRRAINYYPFEPDYLEELYEDLKKLKGE